MKYKIEIEWRGRLYLATLYVRRYWFLWFVVDNRCDDMAYTQQVIDWQKQYNIPDERVIIYQ